MSRTGRVAMGCKKPKDHVIRDPRFKYFTPTAFYAAEKFPDFFSGAGYIFHTTFARSVASIRDKVPGNP